MGWDLALRTIHSGSRHDAFPKCATAHTCGARSRPPWTGPRALPLEALVLPDQNWLCRVRRSPARFELPWLNQSDSLGILTLMAAEADPASSAPLRAGSADCDTR